MVNLTNLRHVLGCLLSLEALGKEMKVTRQFQTHGDGARAHGGAHAGRVLNRLRDTKYMGAPVIAPCKDCWVWVGNPFSSLQKISGFSILSATMRTNRGHVAKSISRVPVALNVL